MNKNLRVVLSVLLISILLCGCQGMVSQDSIETAIDDVKKKATDQIKKAIIKEIKEFFNTDDLATVLGISSDELDEIQSSIQEYVNNYEFDEESLEEAKASVEHILQNAQGLSVEEIKQQISDIFEK